MASLKVLKKGGIFIIFFFLACAVWIVVQNTAGIMIAKALGIEPIIGIMACLLYTSPTKTRYKGAYAKDVYKRQE